ncbi:hypothetical protein QBC34DRAFT_413167 [Podospora aff. communis PSN243]|uniref:Uncharacterized protein n=1 Tax=Podospora aff. communis PSN243 TaxID=3040156 RepID=A0AAV9GE09_9PEZI|nr:hypothetical protein QBC34DRAFT_413167 [Podospora aff. communis PSN243]
MPQINNMAPRQALTGTRLLATLALVTISAFSFWTMRIRAATEGFPVGFNEDVFERKLLADGTPLKTAYTRISSVDNVLSMLVAAFIPGSAGWLPEFQAQQIYFLAQFSAMVAVMTVESHRVRNQGRWIRFAGVVAAVYQCFGAAVILPLYCMTFVWTSGKDGYFAAGRQVRNSGVLLPAVVLGYVLPTALMFYPWSNILLCQWCAAIWQAAPLYPNLLVYLFSLGGTAKARSKHSLPDDVGHVKRLCALTAVLSACSHVGLLYVSMRSETSTLTILSSILLPEEALRMKDTANGLLWIFQWDFFGAFAAALLWSWVSVVEVRCTSGKGQSSESLIAALSIGVLTLLGGPGTALSAVWYWRETEMAASGPSGRVKAT